MPDLSKALETQLANIQSRTGKSLAELAAIIKTSGLTKHGDIRDMLKRELGMGHGDANTLVHHVLASDGASAAAASGQSPGQVLDAIYAGPKSALRPIHARLVAAIERMGAFEVAPKKGYVSLRRSKQFATIGPATNSRVDVGLNMKGVAPTARLEQLPAGQMCQYKVRLTEPGQVDDELIAWIRRAFDGA
jgi:hypothetical protein